LLKRPLTEITFLDPACGSGHFLIEAFELFYAMYVEEGALTDPAEICGSIRNVRPALPKVEQGMPSSMKKAAVPFGQTNSL
jgi:hypothetical protein